MINPDSRTLRNKFARAMLYLEADGKCRYCGKNLNDNWQVDHFFPWCKGGKTTMFNLRASCKECNQKKGKKIIMKNSNDYEKMNHFSNDFPQSSNVRICQIGAYNCIVEKLIYEKSKSCSVFLPTGTGKSDVVRMVAIGLAQKRQEFKGVWAFSPSKGLQSQLTKDGVEELFKRINYTCEKFNPFYTENSLDNERFRSNSVLESFTTQYLTTNGNVNLFLKHAEREFSRSGKYPIAIFDESHLLSTDNEWGAAALKMQEIGIPIVLITGTPFRSDNIKIPGFIAELEEKFEKQFKKTEKSENPLKLKIITSNREVCRYKLKADYEYTYKRAWEDNVILKPEVHWVDGVKIESDEVFSQMSRTQSDRMLRAYLVDERTIRESVRDCISSLKKRKQTNSDCAALITTLSDNDDNNNECNDEDNDNDNDIGDIHAKKIKREIERQSPDLKTLIITSKTNSENGFDDFKNKKYDIMIVKAMGTIGFNCPRIKTIVNLSNYRTLPAFIQLANRGCRLLSSHATYDVIMPKDKGMKFLFEQFMETTGLVIQECETLNETEIEVDKKEKEEKTIESNSFGDHNVTYTDAPRNEQDEIIEMFNRKFSSLANKMTNQEKLTHYEHIAETSGKDWLKYAKEPSEVNKDDKLLDINEEESRLRAEVNDKAKEIINEILSLKQIKYNKSTEYKKCYSDISIKLWSSIKKRCGFKPNQKLKNLTGIENYNKFLNIAKTIQKNLLKATPGDYFDYTKYL